MIGQQLMSIMEGYKMTLPEPHTKEWLLLNAVCMWLKEFPDHEWTPRYLELKHELSNPTQIQKRGRPAKRQRKTKATSNTSSQSKDSRTN